MLTVTGKQGVPQGGVISPLLSNLYLTEVDRMLERAKENTRCGRYTYVEYARFADDLVILIDAYRRQGWLLKAVEKRLREELAKLQVEINEEKSRIVDLAKGEKFAFLGFDFRRTLSNSRVWRPQYTPDQEADGAAGEAQGNLPAVHQPTCGAGDRIDQSDSAGMGELLRGGTFEPVLFVCQRLGGEEGPATPDACPEAERLRLAAVE